MLEKFPLEIYSGYFSHYDESFEWKWFHEQETGLYLIVIFLSGWIPTLKVSKEDLINFGAHILKEFESAPEYSN
ncbi:hypothetical protein [Paenibacillus sp. YPG26]|uniref:hypothetical protein n=1 Tax=Paenibacillus sp. YPG26 TaxID=2878915 RepID=UPI00203A5666|nr:hypothetical protein [Paenibacillus sp. YPG26]USB33636.1 hypothetical protein LDO05_02075 [Paenibacillus sp. YPG26]